MENDILLFRQCVSQDGEMKVIIASKFHTRWCWEIKQVGWTWINKTDCDGVYFSFPIWHSMKIFFFIISLSCFCKGLLFPGVSLYFEYSKYNLSFPSSAVCLKICRFGAGYVYVGMGVGCVCVLGCVCLYECTCILWACELFASKRWLSFETLMSHSSCLDCCKQAGKYLL